MKQCKKCGKTKLLTEFYKDKSMLDGLLNQCRECVNARCKKRRIENKDYVRWFDRQRYLQPIRRKQVLKAADKYNKNNREMLAKRSRDWQKNNPEKYAAHLIVKNAMNAGFLKRQPCLKCGNPKSEAHHEDYTKPLDVTWLCDSHHVRRHNEKKQKS